MDILAFAKPFLNDNFEIGFYIFIALFAIVAIIHLVLCYLSVEFWRKITKPFCLVLLGAAMAFLVPDYPLVYISCWVSAIGDALLIRNKNPNFFVTGAIVFAAAHTLNAIVQVSLLKGFTFPSYVWAILAGVVVIAGSVGYFTAGEKNVVNATVAPAYACFHFVNLAFAVMLLIDNFVGFEIMILLGYIVYAISDLIVNYVITGRELNRKSFYIMLSYLTGQILIYLGLAFSLIG